MLLTPKKRVEDSPKGNTNLGTCPRCPPLRKQYSLLTYRNPDLYHAFDLTISTIGTQSNG